MSKRKPKQRTKKPNKNIQKENQSKDFQEKVKIPIIDKPSHSNLINHISKENIIIAICLFILVILIGLIVPELLNTIYSKIYATIIILLIITIALIFDKKFVEYYSKRKVIIITSLSIVLLCTSAFINYKFENANQILITSKQPIFIQIPDDTLTILRSVNPQYKQAIHFTFDEILNERPNTVFDFFLRDFLTQIQAVVFTDVHFSLNKYDTLNVNNVVTYPMKYNLDFANNIIYLSYYVPATNDTMVIGSYSRSPANSYLLNIDWLKTKVKGEQIIWKTGQPLGELKDLVFNKHIYIYTETDLPDWSKNYLLSIYKEYGLVLEFRGQQYFKEQLNKYKVISLREP